MADPLDTNVVVRYLVEDPETVDARFRGVFTFFEGLDHGSRTALLTPLVLFQSFFVLTRYYEVPPRTAAEALRALLALKGLTVPEKPVLRRCLDTLTERSVDLVDAYLAALCAHQQSSGVYSYDEDLTRLGVTVLPVE